MENEASCAKMYLSLPQREVPPPPPHDLSLLSSVRERDLYVEARPEVFLEISARIACYSYYLLDLESL